MQRNPEARNTISDLRGVLVSFGCHVKVPQTEWLKTTEIYFLTVLDARSLKSCQKGHALSEGSKKGSLPGLSVSF